MVHGEKGDVGANDGDDDGMMVIKVKCCPFLATDSLGWSTQICNSDDDDDSHQAHPRILMMTMATTVSTI